MRVSIPKEAACVRTRSTSPGLENQVCRCVIEILLVDWPIEWRSLTPSLQVQLFVAAKPFVGSQLTLEKFGAGSRHRRRTCADCKPSFAEGAPACRSRNLPSFDEVYPLRKLAGAGVRKAPKWGWCPFGGKSARCGLIQPVAK